MTRSCPPCDYRCQCGKECPSRGGNYYAEFAENNFQHLAQPAPVAKPPLPVEYAGIEPDELDEQRDYAKAILHTLGFALAICAAVGCAYLLVRALMIT